MRCNITLAYFLIALFSMQCQSGNSSESVVIVDMPDKLAEFPGGNDKIGEFISENFNKSLDQLNVQGKVYVTFVITSNGELTDAKINQGLCESCDAEVLRLIKSMPKWRPAQKDGKNVSTRMALPVSFKRLGIYY